MPGMVWGAGNRDEQEEVVFKLPYAPVEWRDITQLLFGR